MIIECPCCKLAFSDTEAKMYRLKTPINNHKKKEARLDTWEYLGSLDNEEEAPTLPTDTLRL